MRMKQLECYVDLAHTTSLTKTAKNMHMAIPSLSETIDRMESEVGCNLFVKTSKGYFLNDRGEMFLRDAEQIVIQYKNALYKLDGFDITNTIHFGIDPSILPLFFSQLLDKHMADYAEETLELVKSNYYNFKDDLLTNKIDICYSAELPNLPKHLLFEPLFENELCALMSKKHPLNQKVTIREKDLYDQVIYCDLSYTTPKVEKFLNTLALHGTQIKNFHSPEKPVSMKEVETSNGIMILHADKKDIYTANMALTPISGQSETFGLMYRDDVDNDYTNIIKTMKDYFE